MKRLVTVRQFINRCAEPHPVEPPGGPWRLAHVAAASGRIDGPAARATGPSLLAALVFYVWEQDEDPEPGEAGPTPR